MVNSGITTMILFFFLLWLTYFHLEEFLRWTGQGGANFVRELLPQHTAEFHTFRSWEDSPGREDISEELRALSPRVFEKGVSQMPQGQDVDFAARRRSKDAGKYSFWI